MSIGFDELSARARRGELSRADQQRLEVFLKSSLEARLWHGAARELDEQDRVLPGDHDAVERVMQRTLSAFPARRTRSRRPLGTLLAVAALCIVSVAAASIEGVRYFRAPTKSLAVKAPAPVIVKASPVTVKVPPLRAVVAPSASAPLAAPSALSMERSAPPAVSAPSALKAKLQSKSDAAVLFGAAALARREGNASKAIALFDSLQERFPGSREARLSDMTLGALHLQRGAATDALEHFRRYLRASPGGELASEALWGESQALAALGQRGESQRRLQLLVERFPNSAYATAARAKLKLAAP
jgi:TolA-binding protein